MQLVLSLFPGIDLLARAFEEVWGLDICVVRGPDVIFGGDIRGWHVLAGKFDGVIGGPPCTWWSTASNIAKARGQKVGLDLIPDFERCVSEAGPLWFVMENVRRAPVPRVPGYAVWSKMQDDLWYGGIQGRKRRISFGVRGNQKVPLLLEPVVFVHQKPVGVVTTRALKWDAKFQRPRSTAKIGNYADALKAQGLPEDFLVGRKIPWTAEGRFSAVANGVPMAMGRAIAKAVKEAVGD